jgi:5-methylcytosine-specific restriction endonuclease McrA
MRRDHRTCQYCGRSEPHMTIDHVTPRSRGGSDTWENLVCACPSCNSRKGDRTPERAGMRLLRVPRKPNVMSFMFASRGPFAEAWKTYLNLF